MGEQIKIRAREKVRNIKKFDRAFAFSQRLRTAVVRSKDNYTSVGETKQATAGEYAEEKLKGAGARTAAGAEAAVRYHTNAIAETIKNTGARKKAAGTMKAEIQKSSRAASNYARKAAAGSRTLIYSLTAGGSLAGVVIIVICLIGLLAGSCFGIFFSGEDTGNGMSMQTAIRDINNDYEKQIEKIKTRTPHDRVELTDGNPNWPEVLSVYAVKTAEETEIVSMTDEKKADLEDIFRQMNKITYKPEVKEAVVINETADKNGNITAEEETKTLQFLYINVRHKSAWDMAKQLGFSAEQTNRMNELLSEKNKDLWSSVLYGIGHSNDEIVKVALTQVGNVGGQPYWSWYGFSSRVEWCACFVSWCANECGYIENGVFPKYASCGAGVSWFKAHNRWKSNSYMPASGDVVFFDWNCDGAPDHTGIVEKVDNDYVYTIEGNSGNKCSQNRYAVSSQDILGYGCLVQ